MPLRDHQAIPIDTFNGLFARGRLLPKSIVPSGSYIGATQTPQDHFVDCLNVRYLYNGFGSREGSVLDLTFTGIGTVTRFHIYRIEGQAARYIMLSNDGTNSYLYDSTNMANPIYTWPNLIVPDIALISMYGRAYISPHNRVDGLTNQFLLVYNGSGQALIAGGATPTAGPLGVIPHNPNLTDYDGNGGGGLPTTGDVGNVPAGQRLFGYVFETASGFITDPGPAPGNVMNPTIFTIPTSTSKLDVYNLPTGPSNVVARRLICTPVIINNAYNGNPLSQPWFFVPNGRIPNNVQVGTQATPCVTINFFDTDLQVSAQYLFTQLPNIPAGVSLHSYNNRLIVVGQAGNDSIVLVSAPQQPESFDQASGNIVVDPGDQAGGCRNALDYQGILYIFKAHRTYITQDPQNGEVPVDWPVTLIEAGIGTECFGAALVFDAKGAHEQRFIIADRQGLLQFAGAFAQKPITWNCDDVWKRINPDAFAAIQVVIDPSLFRVYAALPLDGATVPNFILYGDYSQGQQSSPFAPTGGITPDIIKWSPWELPENISSLSIDIDENSQLPVLKFLQGNNVYHLTPVNNPSHDDYGFGIAGYAVLGPFAPDKEGQINHFGEIRARVYGQGTLILAVQNEDGTVIQMPPSWNLSLQPGQDLTRLMNFQSERAIVTFSFGNNFDDWFYCNKFVIYAKPLWAIRPE